MPGGGIECRRQVGGALRIGGPGAPGLDECKEGFKAASATALGADPALLLLDCAEGIVDGADGGERIQWERHWDGPP